MSLAITVHIRPSRQLAFCLMLLVVLLTLSLWRVICYRFTIAQQVVWVAFWLLLSSQICIIWYRKYVPERVLSVNPAGQISLIADFDRMPRYRTAVELAGSVLIWPGLVVLGLKSETGSLHQILIFRDSLDTDDFRRLKVTLLWLARRSV